MFLNSKNQLEGQKEFISRRAFEIAWAVFRCSYFIGQLRLKLELENKAVEIVALASQKSCEESLDSLENLVLLAEAVGEIKAVNAKVLFREIAGLRKAIVKVETIIRQEQENNSAIGEIFAALPPAPTDFFDKKPVQNEEKPRKNKELWDSGNNSAKDVDNSAEAVNNSADLPNSTNNSADSLARDIEGRQELILKKMKEMGNATTKDLTSKFPYLSERTIRAYLQRLCESGLLERVGNSGPGSYYRAK